MNESIPRWRHQDNRTCCNDRLGRYRPGFCGLLSAWRLRGDALCSSGRCRRVCAAEDQENCGVLQDVWPLDGRTSCRGARPGLGGQDDGRGRGQRRQCAGKRDRNTGVKLDRMCSRDGVLASCDRGIKIHLTSKWPPPLSDRASDKLALSFVDPGTGPRACRSSSPSA